MQRTLSRWQKSSHPYLFQINPLSPLYRADVSWDNLLDVEKAWMDAKPCGLKHFSSVQTQGTLVWEITPGSSGEKNTTQLHLCLNLNSFKSTHIPIYSCILKATKDHLASSAHRCWLHSDSNTGDVWDLKPLPYTTKQCPYHHRYWEGQ